MLGLGERLDCAEERGVMFVFTWIGEKIRCYKPSRIDDSEYNVFWQPLLQDCRIDAVTDKKALDWTDSKISM